MSKREQLLAFIVGALILLAGLGFTIIRVNNAIRLKRTEVTKLKEEIWEKKLAVQHSPRDEDQINAYNDRALPADLDKARTRYKAWLLDCANEVGLDDPKVDPLVARSNSKAYQALAFSVKGEGNLEQAIRFLHRFYSVDCLHRIYHLTAKRIGDTKRHDLNISVEALSLRDATSEDQLTEESSDRLAHGDLAAYKIMILYRNFFGPPNNEPTVDSIDEVSAYVGQTVEITVKASDPDKLDKLGFDLDGERLPGADLDEESGQFKFDPEEPGVYNVAVRVTDDGWPPKSKIEEFTINVAEAEEAEELADLPSFDMAKFAYVTGSTAADGEKLAWINLRTEGKVLKLSEGDEFVIGEVKVIVRRISEKAVELEATVLKKRLLVTMGQNLSEGKILPSEEG